MLALVRDLFAQHRKALIVEATLILKNIWEAEDVVQDTFEVILKGGHLSKVEPDKYHAYLYRAVRNNCLSTQRKAVADKRKKDRFEETEPRFEPGEMLEAWDTRQRLRDAVKSLPEQRRLAFEKTYLEGKPHRQVAMEMELKLETVKSHIKIALKNLRDRLKHLR
ncbi:RNA polymerase sigma factor [Chitinophaga caseinilytica]|uniref:RNA polymerase sigma factor n=1 Tax=Chitinophaga caseinilytica TaxID=2267521 RepID=UPI003C2D4C48